MFRQSDFAEFYQELNGNLLNLASLNDKRHDGTYGSVGQFWITGDKLGIFGSHPDSIWDHINRILMQDFGDTNNLNGHKQSGQLYATCVTISVP